MNDEGVSITAEQLLERTFEANAVSAWRARRGRSRASPESLRQAESEALAQSDGSYVRR
jgi:hypothetical protein